MGAGGLRYQEAMRTSLAITVFLLTALLPCAIARETPTQPAPAGTPVFTCATDELWGYLRKGLTFLESPKPLLPPEAVSPEFIHPDGRGFGAYGFSPEAYEDVQRRYPFFKQYSWDRILHSPRLYDLANQALCDWMLKCLGSYIPRNADKKEVFIVLHKAWNLGVGGFKKGREVVRSRSRRAEEFLTENG
jgi:hypothetical protein